MLQQGILNPHVLSLLARIRHTNTLVIADWAFPFWPQIETVDISLVAGIPTVLQVFEAIQPNFKIGEIWMAREFLDSNPQPIIDAFNQAFSGITVTHEAHVEFKKRVPRAIGLIRTADPTAYANCILESA